jgi:hypothetical protein
MNRAAVLANWYNGPLRRQGHGQQPKSGNPAHHWHWLQKTDQAGKAYPWWLARLRTSKLLSKLSTMRKAMALRFTMTLPHSKIRLQ